MKSREKNKSKLRPLTRLIHSKSYQRNLALMKLWIGDSNFQKEVGEIRAHLRIPPKGFQQGKDDAQKDKWSNWLEEETNTVLESSSFLKQEQRIKENFKRKLIGQRIANKQLGLLYEKIPYNYMRNRARFICDKFNLPVHFTEYIIGFIVWGIIDAPQHNYVGGTFPPRKDLKDVRYIPINIYTRLMPDELKELKHYIDWLGGNYLPQHRLLKNIDRDLNIEKWYEERRYHDPVAAEDKKIAVADLAEEYLGDRKRVDQIYDILRNLKETRERRTGKKKY